MASVGNQPRCRYGLTLIELLVVIAIVGILVALLLPAVQMVRESARRTSCQSRLSQIGLALHQYHDVSKSLPIGCVEWRGWDAPPTNRQLAWSVFVLPFAEQGNLYDSLDLELPFDHPVNSVAAATRLKIFECPSVEARPSTRGRIDFGGLYGERMIDRRPDDGVFLYDRATSFKQISDGLSNTMIVAEDVGGPDNQWINGRNVFVQAGRINDPAAWVGDNEIRSHHAGGAVVLFADAHVVLQAESTSPWTLGALITKAGSEVARR